MGNGSGRLVDSLAESLVNVLSQNKDLSLTNNDSFGEVTETLHKVLDKQEKAEERDKAKTAESNGLLASLSGYFGKDVQKGIEKKKAEEKKKNEDEDKEGKKLSPDKRRKLKEEEDKEKEQKTREDRILELVEQMPKTISAEIKKSNKAAIERSIKMERSIKKTIKSRVGKLWSIFKKLLIVGLLLFFAPVLKNAFSKMADVLKSSFQKFKDLTEPLWRPFIEWFQAEFPMLTDYIKEMAGYVKKIGGAIKLIADGINSLIEWKEEHSTLAKGIEGALVGASMGAVAGSIVPGLGNLAGAILGGLLGFGVGAGNEILKERYEIENSPEAKENAWKKQQKFYETDEGKKQLRKDAEQIVDYYISRGEVDKADREYAIEQNIKHNIAVTEWDLKGQNGDMPRWSDFYTKQSTDTQVVNEEDVDLEGANHTSTDTAVEDDGASGGSEVAMQNIESHSQVTIIQNFRQANDGLDNC